MLETIPPGPLRLCSEPCPEDRDGTAGSDDVVKVGLLISKLLFTPGACCEAGSKEFSAPM